MSQSSLLKAGPASRGLTLLVACSLLVSAAVPSFAQTSRSAPSANELLDALKGKGSRGVSVGTVSNAVEQQRMDLIQNLKAKAQRGLSPDVVGGLSTDSPNNGDQPNTNSPVPATTGGSALNANERTQLAEAVKDSPQVNIEVPFAFDSYEIGSDAVPALTSLGKALQDGSMKASDFLLAGHTDAKGKPEYNQVLSQKRADAVRAYLVTNFSIAADKLVAVGYGREKLKDKEHPLADVNRRVQVVNMSATTTASAQGTPKQE